MSAAEYGGWGMIKHGEESIRSSDTLHDYTDRKREISDDSSLPDPKSGKDLEEFLRAVYRAQRRLAAV